MHGNHGSSWFLTFASWTTFWLFVIFHCLQLTFNGAWAFAWFWYLGFASIMTAVRLQLRERLSIPGNIWEDFFGSLFLYPCCALQVTVLVAFVIQVGY